MAPPLTQTERDHITTLIRAGRSAASIAKETGRSSTTISAIGKEIGWDFGQPHARRAREARSAYCAEKRAELAAIATLRAEEMLARMEGEYRVYSFGGRDNTYAEQTLDSPPSDALRAMAQTFRELMRTVLDVDRHDNRAEDGVSAVDEWLRSIVGEAGS